MSVARVIVVALAIVLLAFLAFVANAWSAVSSTTTYWSLIGACVAVLLTAAVSFFRHQWLMGVSVPRTMLAVVLSVAACHGTAWGAAEVEALIAGTRGFSQYEDLRIARILVAMVLAGTVAATLVMYLVSKPRRRSAPDPNDTPATEQDERVRAGGFRMTTRSGASRQRRPHPQLPVPGPGGAAMQALARSFGFVLRGEALGSVIRKSWGPHARDSAGPLAETHSPGASSVGRSSNRSW